MLYTAFIGLEKAYDRMKWGAFQDVLRICHIDGRLLPRVKTLYNESCACVCLDNKICNSFWVRIGVLDVTLSVYYIHIWVFEG